MSTPSEAPESGTFFEDVTEPPDLERGEALAEAIVRACNDFGATPAEVVAATSAVFANHAIATRVPEYRAVWAVQAMYAHRRAHPVTAALLINKPKASR